MTTDQPATAARRAWRWFVRQVEASVEFPPERGFRYVYTARFKAQAAVVGAGAVVVLILAGVLYAFR